MSSGNRKNGWIAYPNTRFQVRNGQVIRPPQAGIVGIQAAKGNENINNLNNNGTRANSAQDGANGQARDAYRQQNNVNVNGNGAAAHILIMVA